MNAKCRRLGRRLGNAWRHLQRGTLYDRVRQGYADYASRRDDNKKWKALWAAQFGNLDKAEVEVAPGIRMLLYRDSRLSIDLSSGTFERHEREFIRTLLRPGEIFIDVGAHFGYFTLLASHCVGGTGRVHAFEPSTQTYARLARNVLSNKLRNVSCHKVALSDTATERSLCILPDGREAWNSLVDGGDNPFRSERVPCTTWDDFAHENGLIGRVMMMKIDVEGWEKRVLDGGCKTLRRDDAPILQVEFSDPTYKRAGFSTKEVYGLLESYGYSLYAFDADRRRLIHEPLRDEYEYSNLIALKDNEIVRTRLLGYV